MLLAFTAGQIDLLQSERVRQIAAFPQVVSLGGGRYVNFSDAHEQVVIHSGLGSRLSARLALPMPELNLPRFHADPVFRWGHITRDLLWTDANALDQPATQGSFYLHNLAWVIDRQIWNGNTVAFAAKGGHNDEPHNHNDLGHFILHVGGESLLSDLGAGVYNRQYFNEQRYESLHTGSQGHSVPLINGMTQSEGAEHRAVPVNYEKRADDVTFTLDLTRAYDDSTLETFVRSFNWSVDPLNHTAVLRLHDTFRFNSSGGHIVECFISAVSPRIEENIVMWQGSRGKVTMAFDPAMFDAEVKVLDTQTHRGDYMTVYSLQLHAKKRIQNQPITLSFEMS
jgi:hypothetical protein